MDHQKSAAKQRCTGTMRFNDIHRAVPDISQKMLTTTLKSMERDGLVARKVEYTLTERALSLMPLLDQLLGWSLEHFGEIMAERQKHFK